MSTIVLTAGTGTSTILFRQSIADAGTHCPLNRTVIVADSTFCRIHGHLLPPNCPVLEVDASEKNKTLQTVERLYRKFLALPLDRTAFILAVGGGMVCDVAGFAASTYLRGLPFAFAPTTLLAQADAAVGGKNGVNFGSYKNLVGTIQQPRFVLCDHSVLGTLPATEIRNGIAEVIKHGAIGDPRLFCYLERHVADVLALNSATAHRIVSRSLSVKARVVSNDETEQGERKTLNFGHTVGHAVETTTNLSHGMAISVGMALAARLSVAKGLLRQEEAARLERLLASYGLPVTAQIQRDAFFDAMGQDKKRRGDQMGFVLLRGIGKAQVLPIPMKELYKVFDDLCQP